MIGLVSAGIGLGSAIMSGIQALNSKKKMEQAQAATKSFVNQYKNIKEENAFSALKAPDISTLSADINAQVATQNVEALQAMGPEGAAAVAGLNKGVSDSNLQTMEDQAKLNYQRDAAVAENQQGINQRKTSREADLLNSQIEGSQLAASEANSNMNQSISDIFGGLSSGVSALSSLEKGMFKNMFKKKNNNSES